MQSIPSIISAQNLSIGFRQRSGNKTLKVVASEIDVTLNQGQMVCLLGPNGSGKSTLIRTLAGLHHPMEGNIRLGEQNLSDFSTQGLSKQISTVLTDRLSIGNLSVYELVSFGRSPYTGWFGSLTDKDEQIVQWAIESTGIKPFLHRDVLQLSDGERQKVMIARALAQDTPAVLLDEPTAHLDLPNRVEIIRLLRKLVRDTHKGILFSTHELDLALRAADSLWLISNQGKVITGTPEDLVLDGTFESVFKQDSFDFDRETGSFTLHQPTKGRVSISGDSVAKFWTRRALEREGYKIVESNNESLCVEIYSRQDGFEWQVSTVDENWNCFSVKELINTLCKALTD